MLPFHHKTINIINVVSINFDLTWSNVFWFYHTWTPTKLIGRIWNIWYVQTSWRNLHLPVSLTPPSVATWWSLLLELSYSKLMTRFYLRNLTTSDCSSNHIILCTYLYIVLTRNWLEHRFCRHIHNLNSVPLKPVCQDESRLNASPSTQALQLLQLCQKLQFFIDHVSRTTIYYQW